MRIVLGACIYSVFFLTVGCSTDSGASRVHRGEQIIDVDYDSLRLVLEGMYDLDQGIRERAMNGGSSEPGFFTELMNIDSKNQSKLKKIMDAHGWIPSSKIGEKAADAIFLIIQHASDSTQKTHINELKTLAGQGEAKPTHAAMMEDRMLMHQGEKQIYGTQGHQNAGEEGFIWPIKNVSTVNDRRKKAGFDTSVEENAARLGLRFDPKEKLPLE